MIEPDGGFEDLYEQAFFGSKWQSEFNTWDKLLKAVNACGNVVNEDNEGYPCQIVGVQYFSGDGKMSSKVYFYKNLGPQLNVGDLAVSCPVLGRYCLVQVVKKAQTSEEVGLATKSLKAIIE